MIPIFLTRIKTRDGITLDGVYAKPKRRGPKALIWIHGLGSNFAHGQTLIEILSAACQKAGIGYFKFNTRGHDIVSRGASKEKGLQGSGFEKFEECVSDIRAMISSARKLGYNHIVLAGHSTGANKVLYYLYKTRDRSVRGLALLGPVNDIAAGRKKFGAAGLARGLALAEKLLKKKSDALMPQSYGIFSARRFLSMFRHGDAEDVFPYLRRSALWKELKTVRVPVAVVFGSRDEYLDRPTKKLIELFHAHAASTRMFTESSIQGADHGFRKKEKELVRTLMNFIKRAIV